MCLKHLFDGIASDKKILPVGYLHTHWRFGSKELSTPDNIIARELCNDLRRCLVMMIQALQQAKDYWICDTIPEMYHEMELWSWYKVQSNWWARAMKAYNQIKVQTLGPPGCILGKRMKGPRHSAGSRKPDDCVNRRENWSMCVGKENNHNISRG